MKMTSVVGYIAVQDLTKASDIIRSRTFDAFFPLFMVAVLLLSHIVAAYTFPGLCGMGYRPESKKEAGIAPLPKVANPLPCLTSSL